MGLIDGGFSYIDADVVVEEVPMNVLKAAEMDLAILKRYTGLFFK